MFQFSMVLYTIGFFEQLGHVKFLNFFFKISTRPILIQLSNIGYCAVKPAEAGSIDFIR